MFIVFIIISNKFLHLLFLYEKVLFERNQYVVHHTWLHHHMFLVMKRTKQKKDLTYHTEHKMFIHTYCLSLYAHTYVHTCIHNTLTNITSNFDHFIAKGQGFDLYAHGRIQQCHTQSILATPLKFCQKIRSYTKS